MQFLILGILFGIDYPTCKESLSERRQIAEDLSSAFLHESNLKNFCGYGMPKLSLAKLERHLYSAVDRPRQEGLDAATYKDYIFGMLFLKCCSEDAPYD
jgi:HsdM-like protein